MTDTYPEITEVIKYIHQHLDEPLSLERLARYAAYSPYHFARIFKKRIGLSPHYYISSIRLQKAKDLLLQTEWTIRDIGLEIGQQSLGTFTTRFTERVGMTPTHFRNSMPQVSDHLHSLQKMQGWGNDCSPLQWKNFVQGTVQAELPFQGVILVGLFSKPIPEGVPLYGTLLSSPGDFYFANVQTGIYYLMATAVSWKMSTTDILLPHTTLRAKSEQAILVERPTNVHHQQLKLTLREPRLDDPPILISLPLLMQHFLQRMQHSNR